MHPSLISRIPFRAFVGLEGDAWRVRVATFRIRAFSTEGPAGCPLHGDPASQAP